MTTFEESLFKKYLDMAESVEKRLVATYGQAEASRLFRRMDRVQFEVVCKAASTDQLKRDWLHTLEHGYANLLHDRKEAA